MINLVRPVRQPPTPQPPMVNPARTARGVNLRSGTSHSRCHGCINSEAEGSRKEETQWGGGLPWEGFVVSSWRGGVQRWGLDPLQGPALDEGCVWGSSILSPSGHQSPCTPGGLKPWSPAEPQMQFAVLTADVSAIMIYQNA